MSSENVKNRKQKQTNKTLDWIARWEQTLLDATPPLGNLAKLL